MARIRKGRRVSFAVSSPCPLVQVAAEGLERGDVHLLDVGEMRDTPLGVLHRLRDLPAESR